MEFSTKMEQARDDVRKDIQREKALAEINRKNREVEKILNSLGLYFPWQQAP